MSPQTSASVNKEEVTRLIDVWLTYQKDAQNIPAIMAAIVKDDKVYWSNGTGYANPEKNELANANTPTNICSNSKVLTATAIVNLVEQGKLSLHDDVQHLLPEYKFNHKFAAQGPVTIQSLLVHTSGLPRDSGHGYWSAPDFNFPDKNALIQSLANTATNAPVGEQTVYSNLGYALLGAVIEKVSGMSYKEYLETHIFKALQMKSSTVEMQNAVNGIHHATGYSAEDRFGNRKPAGLFKTSAMQSAAGISTTVNDWAKFAIWQLNNKPDEPLNVSPSLKQQMVTPQSSDNNGWSRGLGYELNIDKHGETWAMHGGMCPGFNSYMKLNVSKKQGVAVFTNANKVRAAAYVNGIYRILKLSEQMPKHSSSKVNTKEYAGFYDPFPWNSQYYISPWQGGLVILYLPSESLNYALEFYQPKGTDTFAKVVDGQLTNEQLQFLRDTTGKITHVENGGNTHPKRANAPSE